MILADESNPINGLTFDNVVVSPNVPYSLKTTERELMFAGLKEPIHDSFMHPLMLWVYTIAFCILIAGLVSLVVVGIGRFMIGNKDASGTAAKNDPLLENQGNAFMHKKTIILILGSVLVAVGVQQMLNASEISMNVNSYFACEGVVNGTATGETWPIPSCFTDETSQSEAAVE